MESTNHQQKIYIEYYLSQTEAQKPGSPLNRQAGKEQEFNVTTQQLRIRSESGCTVAELKSPAELICYLMAGYPFDNGYFLDVIAHRNEISVLTADCGGFLRLNALMVKVFNKLCSNGKLYSLNSLKGELQKQKLNPPLVGTDQIYDASKTLGCISWADFWRQGKELLAYREYIAKVENIPLVRQVFLTGCMEGRWSELTIGQAFEQLIEHYIQLEYEESSAIMAHDNVDGLRQDFTEAKQQFEQKNGEVQRPPTELWWEFVTQRMQILAKWNVRAFLVPEDRDETTRGDTKNNLYGLHITRKFYLNGIAETGLQPRNRGGSTKTNTADQQIGSDQTSENVNAFATCPTALRPYIIQFSDSRDMLTEKIDGMSPVALRFLIPASIGRDAQFGDFMQGDATNTPLAIPPEFIEMLTEDGWVPVQRYPDRQSIELIKPQLAANTHENYSGVWFEAGEINNFINRFTESFKGGYPAACSANIKLRNTAIEVKELRPGQGKGTWYFIGCSLQTSGNPSNWSYTFLVPDASIAAKQDTPLGSGSRVYSGWVEWARSF
ncbi:hypothetical protein [Colwellia psychrerythraea]|nr:hypothetical protein [Colwellia psychrerythraea]